MARKVIGSQRFQEVVHCSLKPPTLPGCSRAAELTMTIIEDPAQTENSPDGSLTKSERQKVGLLLGSIIPRILLLAILTLNRWSTPVAAQQTAPQATAAPQQGPSLPAKPEIEPSSAGGSAPPGPVKPTTVRPSQPSARQSSAKVDMEGAWLATVADAKTSATLKFNAVQNSAGDVVGAYMTSAGGDGFIKGKIKGQTFVFQFTQLIQKCPGIFKGSATMAGDEGNGTYVGTDCLGDHRTGRLTMTKAGHSTISQRQEMQRVNINEYLRAKLLIWTPRDAADAFGEPITHDYAYDESHKINGDIYRYVDPTLATKHVDLMFDATTKLLREAYLYPNRMTWDECKQLWGDKFEVVGANPNGTKFHTYTNLRIRVFLDKNNNVLSLGLY